MTDADHYRVWHKIKHDNFTVSIVSAQTNSIESFIRRGGIWVSDTQFVPWHSVSHIEYVRVPTSGTIDFTL